MTGGVCVWYRNGCRAGDNPRTPWGREPSEDKDEKSEPRMNYPDDHSTPAGSPEPPVRGSFRNGRGRKRDLTDTTGAESSSETGVSTDLDL